MKIKSYILIQLTIILYLYFNSDLQQIKINEKHKYRFLNENILIELIESGQVSCMSKEYIIGEFKRLYLYDLYELIYNETCNEKLINNDYYNRIVLKILVNGRYELLVQKKLPKILIESNKPLNKKTKKYADMMFKNILEHHRLRDELILLIIKNKKEENFINLTEIEWIRKKIE